MTDAERIEELEKECRHFQRQFALLIEHVKRTDRIVQTHEHTLYQMKDDNK